MITLWIHYVSGCLLQTAKVSYSKRYIYVGRIGEVVLDLQCLYFQYLKHSHGNVISVAG